MLDWEECVSTRAGLKCSSNATEPTVLIVGHVVPWPPSAGNESRLLRLLTWLKSRRLRPVLLLNHDPLPPERMRELQRIVERVHFVGECAPTPARRRRISDLGPLLRRKLAKSLPDSRIYSALYGMPKARKRRSDDIKRALGSEQLIAATGHLCARYEPFAVIAEYVFAAPCLDAVSADTLKIIDTYDMFSRKAEQVRSNGIDDPLPCTLREERRYLLKGDLVVAIQSYEAALFRRLVPERDVITVGIDCDVVAGSGTEPAGPETILLVASDNLNNQHGLRGFLTDAWPIVRAEYPGVVLRIVGRLANHVERDLGSVQPVGWVADLADEYRTATVVINPTVVGTGLKIKSVEALCHGKALVGTPLSVEGLDAADPPPYRVCGDWHGFAAAVVRLLRCTEERVALERSALQFARGRFSAARVYAPLAQKLGDAQARRAATVRHGT